MEISSLESPEPEPTKPPPLATQQTWSSRDPQASAKPRPHRQWEVMGSQGSRLCVRYQPPVRTRSRSKLMQENSRSRLLDDEGPQTRARRVIRSFNIMGDMRIAGCSTTLASRSMLRRGGARCSRQRARVMSDFYTAREIEESQECRRVYQVYNSVLFMKDDGRYRTSFEVTSCFYSSIVLTLFLTFRLYVAA
jgi:hypothetical protein